MFFLNQRKKIVLSCLILFDEFLCHKILFSLIKNDDVKLTLVSQSTIIIAFNLFYWRIKSLLLKTKWVFKHPVSQMFGLNLNKMWNFHSLEVVGRGSETHLKVSDFFKLSALRDECSYGPFQVWIYSLLGDVSFTKICSVIYSTTQCYILIFFFFHKGITACRKRHVTLSPQNNRF